MEAFIRENYSRALKKKCEPARVLIVDKTFTVRMVVPAQVQSCKQADGECKSLICQSPECAIDV